jgi:hypothetical protein
MERIPGQREGAQIDEEPLLQWADAVRKGAAEVDRAAVADLHIGQVLAHSPEDPGDGAWPHRTVRTVIEMLESDDIDRGLMIERVNMRGVYTKDPFEGGAQERDLATQCRDWAAVSRARWPRVARALEAMARSWEERAQGEDMEAEKRKLD